MGAKRASVDEVLNRLKKIEDNLGVNLEGQIEEFKGSRSSISHICINCKKRKISNLKNLERGAGLLCKACSIEKEKQERIISIQIISNKIKSINQNILDRTGIDIKAKIKEYKGTETIVEHECLICGKMKSSNFGNFIKGTGMLCKECGYKSNSDKMTFSREILVENLINKFDKYPDIDYEVLENLDGANSIIKFKCASCNNLVNRRYSSLIRGYPLCKECLKKQRSSKLSFSENEVRSIIERKGCKWVGGKYINNRSKLEIECSCSEIFKCSLAEFQDSQTRCEKCSRAEPTGEYIMEAFLDVLSEERGYQIVPQETFDDLKSDKNKLLKFDFAVYNGDKLIKLLEFDGPQHREYTTFFHRNLYDFIDEIQNDERKDEYCHNKYDLVRIADTEINNLDNILLETFELDQEFLAKVDKYRRERMSFNYKGIYVYNLDKEFIGKYRTQQEIIVCLSKVGIKINHSDISACLRKKRNQAKGLIFLRYSDLQSIDSKLEYIKATRYVK